jgi:hypothetical protein
MANAVPITTTMSTSKVEVADAPKPELPPEGLELEVAKVPVLIDPAKVKLEPKKQLAALVAELSVEGKTAVVISGNAVRVDN